VNARCLLMIGRPNIVLASSEKAWKALNSRAMNRTPPRVKAPAEVFGMSSQTVPMMIAMTRDVNQETMRENLSCHLSKNWRLARAQTWRWKGME
nr:hypothetical protein [Tanacetum cinerariifolium]